jgi:hypothetical protein
MQSFIPGHGLARDVMLIHSVHVRALSTLRVLKNATNPACTTMFSSPNQLPLQVFAFLFDGVRDRLALQSLACYPRDTRYRFRGILRRPVETDELFLIWAVQAPHASN